MAAGTEAAGTEAVPAAMERRRLLTVMAGRGTARRLPRRVNKVLGVMAAAKYPAQKYPAQRRPVRRRLAKPQQP